MGTKISWADETWNPIIGCSKISSGCRFCYAERMALRLAAMECSHPYREAKYLNVVTADKATKGWTGQTFFVESALTKPLHWKTPRKIFVCSMSDLFHESVPITHFGIDGGKPGWLDRIFCDVIGWAPQHQYMVLTKRPKRMKEYMDKLYAGLTKFHHGKEVSPLPQLHLGVTVENQDNVGRIRDLARTPYAKGFVSFEPLLGRIVLPNNAFDYAFIGCESGPGARLCTLDDIRHVMQECREADVKIHVKQIPLDGKCNKNIKEWPKEFQVRETKMSTDRTSHLIAAARAAGRSKE